MSSGRLDDYILSYLLLLKIVILYISQKQLPRKMKMRLLIIECAGYILWQ